MKNSKSIATIVFITMMILIIMSCLCGCVNHLEDEVVIEDFVCQLHKSDNTINLKDLSEEGKKRNILLCRKSLTE